MNDNEELNFTDCENVDINRRLSELHAATYSASSLFCRKQDLEDEIKTQTKDLKSYWYFVIFVVGLITDYMLRKSNTGFEINFGTFIWLLTIGAFYNGKYQIYKLETEISKIGDMLIDMEYRWIATTGAETFFELINFIKDSYLDEDDESYRDWLLEQRHHILKAVCGYDKGKKIVSRELEAFNILEPS